MKNARIVSLLSALVVSALLTACGGSSDSSATSSTGANYFAVKNATGFDIASVSILDENGTLVSTQAFECKNKDQCGFNVDFNAPGTLKFMNAKGALISAYVLTRAPGATEQIEPTTWSLGYYIYSELRKLTTEHPSIVSMRLSQFFENYDDLDELNGKYEELGMYYLYRTVYAGVNDATFYQELQDQLANAEVLKPNNEISRLYALSQKTKVVGASGGVCPTNYEFKMMENVFAFFPVPGLKEVTALLSNLGQDICNGSGSGGSYNDIQIALQKQDVKIDKLIDMIAEKNAREVMSKIQTDNDRLDQFGDAYYTLVTRNGYTSLKQYFDAHGGIENTFNQNTPNNVQLLIASANMNNMITTLKAIGNQNNQKIFSDALDAMCGIAPMENDIIANRLTCNILMVQQRAIIAKTHGDFLVILKDIMLTLDAYETKEKSFLNSVTARPSAYPTWSDYYETNLKTALQASMSTSLNIFKGDGTDGYYLTTKGLPEVLLNSLKSENCSYDDQPNVIGWVRNGNNESHISVRCFYGVSYYKTKYYYEGLENVQVKNVYGVVVPFLDVSNYASTTHNVKGFYVSNKSMYVYVDGRHPNLQYKPQPNPDFYAYYYLGNGLEMGRFDHTRYTPTGDADPYSYVLSFFAMFFSDVTEPGTVHLSVSCLMAQCARNGQVLNQINVKDISEVSLETFIDSFGNKVSALKIGDKVYKP